tara:strand:- start:956 stop:1342 length:387 start_codon:yes stop_codon:yes gene_type:complete
VRVVFIYSNMREFKLRKGVDPPKPGELIGVAYGGAGSIWPSVFIGARHTGDHFVVTHFVIGWGHRKMPTDLTMQWLRKNSDRIYGERVVDRIIHADTKCLTAEETKQYNAIKSVIEHEYQDHWAVHPI